MKTKHRVLQVLMLLLIAPGVIPTYSRPAKAVLKACPSAEKTIPLYYFRSLARGDKFTTTDPRWTGSVTKRWKADPVSGYRPERKEGYLYDPHAKQPAGTVPIYSWYSPSRKDNFLTSDPRWGISPQGLQWDPGQQNEHLAAQHRKQQSGYTLYRMEGYAFDPKKPQPPGTIPLYSLWSGDQTDNFATTFPAYSISPHGLQYGRSGFHIARSHHKTVNLHPGKYTLYRLEGYILPRPHDRTIHPYYKSCV